MCKSILKLLWAGLLAGGLMLPQVPAALAQEPATTNPAPAAAAEPVVSSPEHPLAYSDQWVDIQPGEYHWYAFKYSFDDSSEQVPAHIRLDANPANGVTLMLVNKEQVRDWQDGEKLQGFGAATPATFPAEERTKLSTFCEANPDDPACNGSADRSASACKNLRGPGSTANTCNHTTSEARDYATWSGVIGSSGTYYIVVRGNPRTPGPIQYKFKVDGMTMK